MENRQYSYFPTALGRAPSEHESEADAGNFGSKLHRNIWKIVTGLRKNVKNYQRFEALELGGDQQARGTPVSIRKIRRSGRTYRKGSQICLEVVEYCRERSASQ